MPYWILDCKVVPSHFWFLHKFLFNVSEYFPEHTLTFDYAIKNSTWLKSKLNDAIKIKRCTSDYSTLRLVWPHLLPSTTTAKLLSKLALQTWNFPRWTKVESRMSNVKVWPSNKDIEKVQRLINLERQRLTIKRPHRESRASPCQSVHGGTNAMACNFTLTTR